MRTISKFFIIVIGAVAMAVATVSCSAQYRAQRHIRRAMELCPELVQMKAYPIDAFLSVPGYTDIARVPMSEVLGSDSFSIETDHGTFNMGFNESDSTFEIGFTADPTEVHYQDTINHNQVVIQPVEDEGVGFWNGVAIWIFGIGLGVSLAIWLLRNAFKKQSS